MPFNYIIEGGKKLSPAQEELLAEIENAHCKLDEFLSIERLRREKRYLVVVSDNQPFIDTAKKELEAYENYIHTLGNKFQRNPNLLSEQESELLKSETPEIIRRKLQSILERLFGYNLLGLYRGYDFSYNSPTIYLFKENIEAYANRHSLQPEYVFGFVFIHEAMHAFYDSKNNCGYLSVKELEEAFAECGMLAFLNRVGSVLPKELSDAARDNVFKKQEYGPYEYGFGLALYKISSAMGEKRSLMSRYRTVSNWIGDKDHDVGNYRTIVKLLRRTSDPDPKYEANAKVCYELVKQILYRDYQRPKINLTSLPGLEEFMRKAGVLPKPGARIRGSHSIGLSGVGGSSRLYSGSLSMSYIQFELATADSLDDLVYAIFKFLENSPRLLLSVINTLNVQTKPAGDTTAPGKWINKEISFPDGSIRNIQGGWNFDLLPLRATDTLDLLRAINFHSESLEFSILDLRSSYVLYGPKSFLKIFGQEEETQAPKPTTSTVLGPLAKQRYTYELTDLSGVQHSGLTMTGLVRECVKSFVSANPTMTAAQLQERFPKTLVWGPRRSLEIIMPAASIPTDQNTRYDAVEIRVFDCNIRVNNQWMITNIDPVIAEFKKLGMKITRHKK